MTESEDVQMKIRMERDNHAWLKKFAEQQERSATWIVNKLIEQAKKSQEAGYAKAA